MGKKNRKRRSEKEKNMRVEGKGKEKKIQIFTNVQMTDGGHFLNDKPENDLIFSLKGTEEVCLLAKP